MEIKNLWAWMSIGTFLFFNLMSVIAGTLNFLKFLVLLDVFAILLIIGVYRFISKSLDAPMSIRKMKRIVKKEYLAEYYGNDKLEVDLEIKEAGRYKEDAYDTKKGVLARFFVVDSSKLGKTVNTFLVKLDPYDKSESTTLMMSAISTPMSKFVNSIADLEMQKTLPRLKSGTSRKTKKKMEWEEESTPISASPQGQQVPA